MTVYLQILVIIYIRFHTYHRVISKILVLAYSIFWPKNMEKSDKRKVVPRVCILGGKAAPGYEIAKKIIKLCHAVAEKVNNDADIGDLLKLVRQRHSFSV